MRLALLFLAVAGLLYILAGCGKTVTRTSINKASDPCTVLSYSDYAVVSCPDGSYHVITSTPEEDGNIIVQVDNDCRVAQDSGQTTMSTQDNDNKQDADTRSSQRQDADQDTDLDNRSHQKQHNKQHQKSKLED